MIFLLANAGAGVSLGGMKDLVYIPPSCRTAEKHLSFSFQKGLNVLSKKEFVRGWCSLAFLYPGLHPDEFSSRDGGWPRKLKPFAAEAWRRAESGELTDGELYCYRATMARVRMEREETKRIMPWLFSDHFAV